MQDKTDFMDQYQWTLKSHISPASSNNNSRFSSPLEALPASDFCWTNPVYNVPGGQKIEPAYYLKQSAETIFVEMWHNIKPHEDPEVNLDVIANQVGQHVLEGLAKDKKENYQYDFHIYCMTIDTHFFLPAVCLFRDINLIKTYYHCKILPLITDS